MQDLRSTTVSIGLLAACAALAQSPCDSLLHASFQASPYPLDGLIITITNTTTSADPANTSYTWSFGNGDQASGDVGAYGYSDYGIYTICLVAVSGNCTDSACTTIVVEPAHHPCEDLDPGFTVTSLDSVATFQNTHQVNDQVFNWSFGDGATGSGLDPMHNYSDYGDYEVCLTASTWDPFTQSMCSAQFCQWIFIQPDTTTPPCEQLDTTFSTIAGGQDGLTVSFQHASWSDAIGFIWALGDGEASIVSSPVHEYAQPGQYYVCLTETAWDPILQDVCQADHCEWITVGLAMGIGQEPAPDAVSAYPQPFNDLLSLRCATLKGVVHVTLLDMAGRLVNERSVNIQDTVTLDYTSVPAGPYLLRLQDRDGEQVLRVMKQ